MSSKFTSYYFRGVSNGAKAYVVFYLGLEFQYIFKFNIPFFHLPECEEAGLCCEKAQTPAGGKLEFSVPHYELYATVQVTPCSSPQYSYL